MIIQRHQLRIGLLASPPFGKSFPHGNEEVHHEHGWDSCAQRCCVAQDLVLRREKDNGAAAIPLGGTVK
jgi:hypothetical protein